MAVFTEGRYPGEFLIGKLDDLSKEVVKIAASQTIAPGTLLGKIAVPAGVVAAASAPGAGKGALTLANPAVSNKVKDGVYTVTCATAAANAGTFLVEDPNGKSIGTATVGVAFDKEIKFTIADGATDHAVGDVFTVTVQADAVDYQWAAHNLAGTDGSEIPTAIALYGVTTGVGETADITAITSDQEVNGAALSWAASINAAQKADAAQSLATVGIKVR